MTRVWIVAALSVLLIAGCNSNGSSSSKDSLYRQIFAPDQQSSPAVKAEYSPLNNSKEFKPGDYDEVYKSPDFREFYDPKKPVGYGIEAFAVLVESTPTVNKYVYIQETIYYNDSNLKIDMPTGTFSYSGRLEYYDPESDSNLESVNEAGKFTLTKTFNGEGKNSIELDWNGNGTPDVMTDIVEHEEHKKNDFTFTHNFPNSEKKLIGHGTFHRSWQGVYGLFKSPNYAGGFKGECDTCPR